jgi:twitching motility protein PilJ
MARFDWKSWVSFRRMKVWQKCALIAVPFIFPIAALLYQLVSVNNENIGIAKAELRGLEYQRPIKSLALQLATHRGLSNRIANGDRSAEPDRAKVSGQIEETIREIDAVDSKLGAEFKTTEKWQASKESWRALRQDLKSETTFQQHTILIAKILEISTDAWEFSGLALDPVAETYYLQDMMIPRAIPFAEDLGQLRGISAGAATRMKTERSPFTDAEKIRVSVLIGSVEAAHAAFEKETKNAIRANAALKGKIEPFADDVRAKSDQFSEKVKLILQDNAVNRPTSSELFASGTEVISATSKLYDGLDPFLTELLEKRASSFRSANYLSVAGTLVGLGLVFIVASLVTRGITRQVNNLTHVFDRIEIGDFKARAVVSSEDELGQLTGSINNTLDRTLTLIQSSDEKNDIQRSIMKLLDEVGGVADGDLTKDAEVSADLTGAIADSFNYMIEQLRNIIGNVQQATLQVSTAANQIHASAGHLAHGSESQAEQIVNTSAAIDEMAVSIQQVSENAVVSSNVAQQALTTAKQGNAAVRKSIDGMNRIREQAQETAKRIKRLGETSQEIGQIVQIIDDIADRTSILALNASIQAAAAGDAGRGFAVVAEEVERLAVRSTDATKKIAALVTAIQGETNEAVSAMEKSIQEVVSGSKVANEAGQSLQEIETVSVKLAELIQQITLASKQQARGSEALAKSMGDISQITQQTASGTKQTADSVNSLAKLADELRDSVATFRLPDTHQVRIQDSNRYQIAK